MRPYQTEVVVQDNETRQLDVVLEKEAAPEKPRLRMVVSCAGQEPLGPDDGLVAYLDGPDVVPPAYIKKRWDAQQGRNVVEYVEYAVDPGQHTIRASVPGCDTSDTSVHVDSGAGAAVGGELRTDTPLLLRGPEGLPGLWRLGAGLWMFSVAQKYKTSSMTEAYETNGLAGETGFAVEGAFITRWFGAFLAFADGYGNMQRQTFNTNDVFPSTTNAQAYEGTFRASFRIPLNIVSWNLIGPEVGVLGVNIRGVNTGSVQAVLGGWTGLDVQPLCDWGASLAAKVQDLTDGSSGPGIAIQFGVFWEPNARCSHERSTSFGLHSVEAAR
jgi:hypothetical protein